MPKKPKYIPLPIKADGKRTLAMDTEGNIVSLHGKQFNQLEVSARDLGSICAASHFQMAIKNETPEVPERCGTASHKVVIHSGVDAGRVSIGCVTISARQVALATRLSQQIRLGMKLK